MNPLGNHKHGAHGTLTYARWKSMTQRCYDPKATNYRYYGGCGVQVCAQWRESFATFLADMGACPDARLTLDRIDNSKGYEPGNCRWATQAEQNRNRSHCVLLAHGGKAMNLTEWAREIGMPFNTLATRIRKGWSTERALSQPIQKQVRKS